MNEELHNCVTEAQQVFGQTNWENQNEINEASNRGSWVVVAHVPFHCRSTDAYIGQSRHLHCECDSQAEAEAIIKPIEQDFDGDFYMSVIGPEAPAGYVETLHFCLPTSTDAGINGGDWADVEMTYDEVVARIAEIEQELRSYTDWGDVPCDLTYELRVFKVAIGVMD